MRTALLVDDESPALHLLAQMIQDHTELQVVGAFTKPSEALQEAKRLRPDVVFLDIEMPQMSGIELAGELQAALPQAEFVFVTAYKEYALEAFGVSALDYLLKPVSAAQMGRCWERLQRRLKAEAEEPAEEPLPASARLVIFGGFELYGPKRSTPVRFSTAKVEELLAFLVTSGGHSISKWDICEKLWPESGPDRAEQNLYTAVYRLKKSLQEYNVEYRLESQRGTYRLIGIKDCELDEFERTVEEIDSGKMSLEDAERSFALYRGPLLHGKDYSWSQAQQERLQRKFSRLAQQLACAYLEKGALSRAVDTLLKAVEQDPLDEDAYVLLLETYAALHDRSSFLFWYEKYRTMLEEELGLKVKPRIRELRDAMVSAHN